MKRKFRQIEVDHKGDVVCVRLRQRRLDEPAIQELGDELLRLIDEQGCRKMVLNLGPGPLACLYSVFLARLVTVHKRLHEHHGGLKLCDVHPETRHVFEVCQLDEYFDFAPDQATAVAALQQ
jgi:anti-anti-sigma factor